MTLPGTFESTSASNINLDEESNDARVVDWGNANVTVADGATVTAEEMEETQAILTQVVSNLLIHLNSFPLNFYLTFNLIFCILVCGHYKAAFASRNQNSQAISQYHHFC